MTKPKIVFLNRCYWPDSEATGQLLTELCEFLANDFEVHVICGQPNSPSEDAIYERSGVSERGNVHIHRLRHTRFQKRIPAGRLINLVSFTRAAGRYLRKTALASDLIISETDPFLLPIEARKHASRTRAKLVCYLQDIYPDVAEAIGKVKAGRFTAAIRSRLKASYDAADRVIVLGRCMQQRLTESPWLIDAKKVRIVPNWANCQAIKPLDPKNNPFRKRESLEDQFVVMHSGNMGLTQRLDVLVDATQHAAWPSDAVLLLVGDGASRNRLVEQVNGTSHPDRVRFLPYQPREKLDESLSGADMHVVSMHEDITGCLCPSKLYGILAAGRPVLAIANQRTDLCQTVVEQRVGWCCEPGDSVAVANAIAEARESERSEMHARARDVAVRCFDREVVMRQFANVLSEVVG